MNDDEVDWDQLAKKYSTDPDSLDPEVREWTDQAGAELERKLKAGKFVERSDPRDNFAIGLDDSFNPLPPVPPKDPGTQTEQ